MTQLPPSRNTARLPGSPVRPGTVALYAVAIVVSLAVAIVLYRAFGQAPDIGFGPRGYVVHGDRSVTVQFEVDKDRTKTALCTVRARDKTGAEVGNSLVRVGPSAQRRTIVSYDLATTGRAASGEITACTLAGAPSGGSGVSP